MNQMKQTVMSVMAAIITEAAKEAGARKQKQESKEKDARSLKKLSKCKKAILQTGRQTGSKAGKQTIKQAASNISSEEEMYKTRKGYSKQAVIYEAKYQQQQNCKVEFQKAWKH